MYGYAVEVLDGYLLFATEDCDRFPEVETVRCRESYVSKLFITWRDLVAHIWDGFPSVIIPPLWSAGSELAAPR